MRPEEDEQKIALLKENAERGDARAQRLLALRYWRGRGVGQSAERAAEWMKQAAAQGWVLAQRDLARFYQDGIGVQRDAVEALRLYRLAARQGDAVAENFIKNMESKKSFQSGTD